LPQGCFGLNTAALPGNNDPDASIPNRLLKNTRQGFETAGHRAAVSKTGVQVDVREYIAA
jgi:hypothetical protein